MVYDTAVVDYTPQQVLWALTLKDGARSYDSDTKAYNEIRDFAFNSTSWAFTPKGHFNNLCTQEQINKAPKRLLMDAVLNACENWSENDTNDNRTFMEYVGCSMNSETYTIQGELIK